MAMIECPECKKEISSKADACPHCGNPIKKTKTIETKRKGGKYEAIGFILISIGIFVCFGNVAVGAAMIIIGFIIFLVGRFM